MNCLKNIEFKINKITKELNDYVFVLTKNTKDFAETLTIKDNPLDKSVYSFMVWKRTIMKTPISLY